MLETTEQIILAACHADPTLADEQIKAGIAAMKSKLPMRNEPLDPVVSVQDACKLCGGKDRHTLLSWSRRGFIVAVRTGKDGGRVTGYLRSSIRRFLNGETQATKEAAV